MVRTEDGSRRESQEDPLSSAWLETGRGPWPWAVVCCPVAGRQQSSSAPAFFLLQGEQRPFPRQSVWSGVRAAPGMSLREPGFAGCRKGDSLQGGVLAHFIHPYAVTRDLHKYFIDFLNK